MSDLRFGWKTVVLARDPEHGMLKVGPVGSPGWWIKDCWQAVTLKGYADAPIERAPFVPTEKT
jgi:hypothetical protein